MLNRAGVYRRVSETVVACPKDDHVAKKSCSVDGCLGAKYKRGLCNKHYIRARLSGELDIVRFAPDATFEDKVRRLLSYDPETGVITWRTRWFSANPGEFAGNMNAAGYIVIGLFGRDEYAHRIAWLFAHGAMPKHTIDHIDGNKANNSIANLRDVPIKVNTQNSRKARRAEGREDPESIFKSFPKTKPVRSPQYRHWVASLPCIACGIHGHSQAAHPNHGRGLGQKASDLDVFPLCCVRPGHMGCHQMHDLLIDMTRDQRRELEMKYTAKTQAMARAANRPEIA